MIACITDGKKRAHTGRAAQPQPVHTGTLDTASGVERRAGGGEGEAFQRESDGEGDRCIARATLGGGCERGRLRHCLLSGKPYQERHSPSKHRFKLLQQSQEYARSWRRIWQLADDKGVEAPPLLHMCIAHAHI